MKTFNEWNKDRQKQEAEQAEFLIVFIFILLGIAAIAA